MKEEEEERLRSENLGVKSIYWMKMKIALPEWNKSRLVRDPKSVTYSNVILKKNEIEKT